MCAFVKAAHKTLWESDVLPALAAGTLPSAEDLDEQEHMLDESMGLGTSGGCGTSGDRPGGDGAYNL